MYLPSIVMVGYYFDKKRALATGVAVCGSGIGTFIFAPLGTFLVDEYGWKGANIIIGALILNGIVFGAIFRPLEV
jgi:MCP family monocarboxylic acid transporter-like MFS transporter 14